MSKLYYNMVDIDRANYLPCWILYMDLVETIHHPESPDFYDWLSIEMHPDAYHLHMYKKNMSECMHLLVAMVENIVRDITNMTPGYRISGDTINISNYMITCENCGRVWDGYAQCDCTIFDIV